MIRLDSHPSSVTPFPDRNAPTSFGVPANALDATRPGWLGTPRPSDQSATGVVTVEPYLWAGHDDAMPKAGSTIFGFHLEVELGRGAFGSVFLATQPELAARKVVVKVSRNLAVESRALARLQHTNIVPVYSVHRAGDFQAVCMPYYGAVTLAELLRRLRGRSDLPQTGSDFVDTFRAATTDTPPRFDGPFVVPSQITGAGDVILESLAAGSYVAAVCWLMARLADGLHHAHERGILHRDIKPANILLTDEGQPMLLDFGVAEEFADRKTDGPVRLGGTLPYMAPEQLREHDAGTPLADGRSDVYALGLVFCELLTRQHPYRTPGPTEKFDVESMLRDRRNDRPDIHRWNPEVTRGLESIVHTCLAFDPAKRYRSAGEFRDDLERYLAHRPMLRAPERSLGERAAKWLRRNRWMRSNVTIATVAVVIVAALAIGFATRSNALARYEAAALRERLDAAVTHVQHRFYGTTDPADIRTGLNDLCATLAQYGLPGDPRWSDRRCLTALSEADRDAVRRQLADACLLAGRGFGLILRHDKSDRELLDRAIHFNRLAEEIAPLDAPRSLYGQRANLLKIADRHDEAKRAEADHAAKTLTSARDHLLAGEDQTLAGRLDLALPLYVKSREIEPRLFWGHFCEGHTLMDLGRHAEAKGAFQAAIALEPDSAPAYFNRGQCHVRLGNVEAAIADFDRVIAKQPDFAPAYHARAVAFIATKDWESAQADLDLAIAHGTPLATVERDRARVRKELGHAVDDIDPDTADGWIHRGLDQLANDPAKALASFERAIACNPNAAAPYLYAAHVLERQSNYAEAKRKLDAALVADPNEFRALAGRALLEARLTQWDAAVADVRAALDRNVSPALLYQAACIYALIATERPDFKAEAITYLGMAIRGGAGGTFETADDLKSLRDLPEFQRLVRVAKTRPVK